MKYNTRKEVPDNYKWDLTSRFKTDEDFEKELDKVISNMQVIKEHKNKTMRSANTLFSTLEDYFMYETKLTKLWVYASLKRDENLDDSKYSLMFNKVYSAYNEFSSMCSFIEPEILATDSEKLEKMIASKKLEKYKFYLENIVREKKHLLSANEELIISKLNSTNGVFRNINMSLLNSTLDYGKVLVDNEEFELTNSSLRTILQNRNRLVRKEAYEKVMTKVSEFKNIFAENLVANMKNTSNMAEIRKFKSTLDMELFSSNLSSKIVDNLYNVVNKRLDVFQKYLDFIKKNLGLDELEVYDLHAPILTDDMSFSVEDAEMLITEATKIYGKEYSDVIKKAFDEKWIDYASYKGKQSGAYCTANYGDNPAILTNFFGKFGDVSAIAHELGHAVNFYLSIKNNKEHDYNNDIFTAEVASLTNEIILSDYIMKNSRNKNLKLLAIYNLIDIIQNNLFDASLEGELENEAYKLIDDKKTIGVDYLCDTIFNIRKKYYGNVVKENEYLKYSWIRREHYFYPFYLFKYATGVSAAINVATKIINDEDNMKEKYIKFLSSGSRDYPTNLLKELGIDMTKESVINTAIDYFESLIDEFNKESDN